MRSEAYINVLNNGQRDLAKIVNEKMNMNICL